jgi:hypothetical protein
MSREKRRKGRSGAGTARKTLSDRQVRVHLVPTVELLHGHVTESLCLEVFREIRTTERQRQWTLYALARFWLAVILEAPRSLSQLLERARGPDPRGFLPQVAASAESFFEKCKAFSSGFFMGLHCRFVEQVLPIAPKQYAGEVAHLQEKFSDIVIMDASRLDKVLHRLKILWSEKAAVLPGCLLAVYDLYRGIVRHLWFEAAAAASEFKRAADAMECLVRDTLVLADRLYCSPKLFRLLNENECFGLFRRPKNLSVRKLRRLRRLRVAGGILEDWLVKAGVGKEALELRLVKLKRGRRAYEALTNVLDPKRLCAEDAVALYPFRWNVERLFYDLKVVLNLKKLYAANPNAVAMQVYAATMVHTAFRIAQADIARKLDLPPEELSPQKLFPLLSLVSIRLIEAEFYFEQTCKVNPGVTLRKPSWKNLPGSVVSLRHIRAYALNDVHLLERNGSTTKKGVDGSPSPVSVVAGN